MVNFIPEFPFTDAHAVVPHGPTPRYSAQTHPSTRCSPAATPVTTQTAHARQSRPPSPQIHVILSVCYLTALQYLNMGTISAPAKFALDTEARALLSAPFAPLTVMVLPVRALARRVSSGVPSSVPVWGCDTCVCQSIMGNGRDHDGVAAPDPCPTVRY